MEREGPDPLFSIPGFDITDYKFREANDALIFTFDMEGDSPPTPFYPRYEGLISKAEGEAHLVRKGWLRLDAAGKLTATGELNVHREPSNLGPKKWRLEITITQVTTNRR